MLFLGLLRFGALPLVILHHVPYHALMRLYPLAMPAKFLIEQVGADTGRLTPVLDADPLGPERGIEAEYLLLGEGHLFHHILYGRCNGTDAPQCGHSVVG